MPPDTQDTSRFSQSYDDVPCVWMTGGVLAYQLCNRKFDCDECPLDVAMRKHFSRLSTQDDAEPTSVPNSTEPLRKEYFYSEQHCWVQKLTGETYRVGIEPQLASVLLIPKSVVLPSLGQRLLQNQSSVWIVLEEGTFPLASPIDGEVVTRNASLTGQPANAFLRPFDNGWFYEVKASPEAFTSLMKSKEANVRYDNDMKKFNELLLAELSPAAPQVGPTLADGGLILQHVADMLGYKKYMKIIKKVFG